MKKQPLLYIYIAFVCTIVFFSFASCKKKTTQIDPEFARYIAAFTYGNISPDSYIEIELAQELLSRSRLSSKGKHIGSIREPYDSFPKTGN